MRAALAMIVVMVVAGAARADGPVAQFKQPRQPHADVPFKLDLQVDGFEEAPAPTQPKLEIPNADVQPLGVQPSTMRSIQIDANGRRRDEVRVTWDLTWRVVPHAAGTLHVPNVTVKQGSKSATARGGDLTVDAIPTSDDMKIELALPTRPVFVGETVPVKLSWLVRAQPEDQNFSVPLANLDTFTVSAPPIPANYRQRPLTIAAGSKDLELAYDVDKATVGGLEYTRLSMTLLVAPRTVPNAASGGNAGKLEIPPSSVVAALQVGRRDFFGNASTRMFRAVDIPRQLEVKQLPESDRPPTFAGAVGEQFSIDVRTSRSVVSLGEPVELEVTIKADQRLDTLALGKLDGPGRLPKDKFAAPAEPPTGELSDDGKAKTFKVVAQVTGPATEIPALDFAYFDPRKQSYQTIKSQPIALSVKGGSIVGANDVIVSKKTQAKQAFDDTSLVNADLALSTGGGGSPLGGSLLWILVGALYALPLGILVFRRWQLHTAESREEAGEVRVARTSVEELLDRSASTPAREIAGPLVAALRELAKVLGRELDDRGLLGRIETEAFAPEAANQPLSPDLRSDAAGLLRRWTGDERRTRGTGKAAAAIVLLAVAAHGRAHADSLTDGRQAYQYAMELTGDATGRKAAFARAATALGDAARAAPDNAELLADWGNAALGAGEVATATLAYRRALLLDPGNTRARHNLAFLRGKLPDRLQPPTATGATDTLLFFHRWPRPNRLLVGAAAFALAILLLVPWRNRRSSTALLAIIPAAIWIAMVGSLVLENRHADDAVVMDAVVLRAADSAGAPAALAEPLPRGVEVTILERRDSWTRVGLPGGTSGWLPDGAVEPVLHK